MVDRKHSKREPRADGDPDIRISLYSAESIAQRQAASDARSLMAGEIRRRIVDLAGQYRSYQKSRTEGVEPDSVLAALEPELRFAAILWRLCEAVELDPNEALHKMWPARGRHALPRNLAILSAVNVLQTDADTMLARIHLAEGADVEATRQGGWFVEELARHEVIGEALSFDREPQILFAALSALGGPMFGWRLNDDFRSNIDRIIERLNLTLDGAVTLAKNANPDPIRPRYNPYSPYDGGMVWIPTDSQGPAWGGPFW